MYVMSRRLLVPTQKGEPARVTRTDCVETKNAESRCILLSYHTLKKLRFLIFSRYINVKYVYF